MKRAFAVLCTLALTFALAQNVATLKQQTTDLPRNSADQFVLNNFFGALSAVQDTCPSGLVASLKEQKALAGCATFDANSGMASLMRTAVEAKFTTATMTDKASWVTPWQANADFGTVRQLQYQGTTYYLTLDADKGQARVIVFQ